MDHLMPGMDGFQAIQAIKGNPDTAMIPVVMYTSQEGELYVSQARALGAVGVLPKTVKQADVSRVLYQLRLLPERREARAAAAPFTVQETAAVRGQSPPVAIGEIEAAIRSRDRPAPQRAQHGDASLRAGEPGSFCTAHRHRDETGCRAPAARADRSAATSAAAEPLALGRRDRRARAAAHVRAGCHPYADTGCDERAGAIEHQARRVRRRTAAAAGSFAPSSTRTRSSAGDGSHGTDRARRRTSKPSPCRMARRRCPVRASSGCAT